MSRDASTGLKGEIRDQAAAVGISRLGFARACAPEAGDRLREWLRLGYHGGMGWMARDPERRIDPQRFFPGARTIVVAAVDYYVPDPVPLNRQAPRVSRYAWGDDYHQIVGAKLRSLASWMESRVPGLRPRVACDTSAVLEKVWAVAAGIGWLGKNTCLIHPKAGSWFFLGEIFVDLELDPDAPLPDRCGTCRSCIEACPTGALVQPNLLDARRCISYRNIEHRGPFPASADPVARNGSAKAGPVHPIADWLVGCDVCQDVCPWNRRAPVTDEPAFRPRPGLADRPASFWTKVEDARYADLVRGSAIRRIKPDDMRRNGLAVVRYREERGDRS